MSEFGRIPRLLPAELDAEQREVYDAVVGGPRAQGPQLFRLTDEAGVLEGPFNALLLQPRVGLALQALGGAIRYRTALTDREREIAILLVAAHWDSAFEWYAHEAVGRHVGLGDDELHGLRDGSLTGLAGTELAVARTTVHLTRDGDLDDHQYAVALAALDPARVLELTTLVGYYATLALQLRVFRVGLPNT